MFFHSLILLRYISLSHSAVCLLLDKANTWFLHRSFFPVVIFLSMLLMTIIFLFWYKPLQRVHIHWMPRCQIRRFLIIREMIFWRQWNEIMAICMMNLILALGRSMECMTKLNLCLMLLKKILEINYTYGSLPQPMEKNILWKVTITPPPQRMDERGGLFRAKQRRSEGKSIFQRKWGRIFWWVI